MPWKVASGPGGFFVVKKESGARVNKKPHKTRAAAMAHLKALYANYKKTNKGY